MPDPHTFGHAPTAEQRARQWDARAHRRDELATTGKIQAQRDHHSIAAEFARLVAERIRRDGDE